MNGYPPQRPHSPGRAFVGLVLWPLWIVTIFAGFFGAVMALIVFGALLSAAAAWIMGLSIAVVGQVLFGLLALGIPAAYVLLYATPRRSSRLRRAPDDIDGGQS